MNRHTVFPAILAATFLVFSIIGCGGGSSPVTPGAEIPSGFSDPVTTGPADDNVNNDLPGLTGQSEINLIKRDDRMVLGVFDVVVDLEKWEVTMLPNRELEIHLDVTKFLLPPSCSNCFGVEIISNDPVTHILSIMISLLNPTVQITVFDMKATILFPEGDNRELVSAEGFTKIFADDVISPYQAFSIEKPQRAFGPLETHYAQMDFYFPPPKNLFFGFVFDCSLPSNQEEPYLIDNEHFDGGFNECNSEEGWLYADMHDWQINATGLAVDLTPIGGEIIAMEHVINQTYRTFLNNTDWMAPAGEYRLWFTASSEDTDFDTYDFFVFNVDPCDNWPPLWDETVGITDLNPIADGLEVFYGNATDSDEPVTYNIYYSEDTPIEWTTASYVNDDDGSPYTLDGLSDDITYYVGVRAVDAFGAEEKNVQQLSGIPSNPPEWIDTIGITGVVPMDKAMEVQFGEAYDPQTPVTYNVYWSDTTPIDFDNADVVNVPGSPYVVIDLTNFQEYYFAVRAMDGFGSEDENTNELPGTPNGPPEWDDTVGIQSTIPGNGTVTVTFGTATDIDLPVHYNVYYSDSTPIDFGTADMEQDFDGSPHTIIDLTNEQTYYFAVRAADAGNDEETNTVELPGIPNSAPTWLDGEVGVQSLIPFDHQVTVNYGTAIDDDLPITYYIYYSTTTPIDFDTADFETTQDLNSYVVLDLDNYVPYFLAVRAEDSMGIMEMNTVELSTIPNPAPIWDDTVGVQSIEVDYQQLTVYYGTASDIDMPVSYRVYYSETSPIDFGTAPYVDDPDGSPTILFPLLNQQTYWVAVRAVDVYGHEDQNTVELSGTPMVNPEVWWSVPTGAVVQASPALVDLNGDTILDVVIGNQSNYMVAYDGNDGSVLWSFKTGSWVICSAAVHDMGGSDSTPDIIFGGIDFNVYCLDGATGAEIWSTPTAAGFVSSPTLANISGDFHPDVILGGGDGVVYAFDGMDGSPIWTFPTGLGIFASPASADINGDLVDDIIIASRDGNVYAINGITGLEIWHFTIGGWINSSPALADLNGDLVPDTIIAGMDGNIYALDGVTGIEIWPAPFSTGSYIWTSPSIAQLNGDGIPDIVLGADSSSVYAIDGATGTEIWSFPSMDRIWSSAALVDLTADGTADVIIGSDDGYLYVLDGSTGQLLFNYLTNDWIDSSPAAADIDGDGDVEIVWGGFDGNVTVITADFTTVGISPWPMFRHDLQNKGVY